MTSPTDTTSDSKIQKGSAPVLRTLSPLLRQLEKSVRKWMDGPHRFPLSIVARASLETLANDLHRQADSLDQDRPLLVIMLMGGTGVGKSTLLNALAGGDIAQASFARPTTKDPVVYYHESVNPDRLDPVLQRCRLRVHNRPELLEKVLVDTPDLDSNDLENREITMRVLPVADIVLYVGSQEKYHDEIGWSLFLEQRRRRAFAFIMNKWDRCQNIGVGLSPDEDWLRDLHAEGFQNPLLFRTCAQMWVDHATGAAGHAEAPTTNGTPGTEAQGAEASAPAPANDVASDGQAKDRPQGLPQGEQFADLLNWLNSGLNRIEIEAIKARGISQLLVQMQKTLDAATPPDLTEVASRTRAAWERLLSEEALAIADVLLNTLEPYQREIEHNFAVEVQRRFRGLMAFYLQLFTKIKYAGNTLRDRIPFMPRLTQKVETPVNWDLAAFTRAASSAAGERHLDARGRALANRLLVDADQQGFPLDLLNEPTEGASHIDWRTRYAQSLTEILQHVQQQWSNPTGTRRLTQGTVIFMADWLPSLALLGSCVMLLWQYTMESRPFDRGDIVLPIVVVVIVLVIMHVLINLVLPLRWPAMRGEFHRQLEQRLHSELEATYISIPSDVAKVLQEERKAVAKLIAETREVADWLRQREHAASITGLYGN